jgi:hypothetical protein
MTLRYLILAATVGHAPTVNAALNEVFPDAGDNLSQPLSPTGSLPATHLYGGLFVQDDATVDALAAVPNLIVVEATGEDHEALPGEARTKLRDEHGLVPAFDSSST